MFWLLWPVFGGLSFVFLWFFFGLPSVFGGFRGLFFVFGGLLTSLDLICHLDDIVQCHGWLITTADTCTQCDCIPDAGLSHLPLSQLTEHCGLNRVMQDGFFPQF